MIAQELAAAQRLQRLVIQRQPGHNATGGTATAAPATDAAADPLAIPPDSPYTVLADPLKEILRESYRAQTMQFKHGPDETLVQVLDRLGMAVLNIASSIYIMMSGVGLAGFI